TLFRSLLASGLVRLVLRDGVRHRRWTVAERVAGAPGAAGDRADALLPGVLPESRTWRTGRRSRDRRHRRVARVPPLGTGAPSGRTVACRARGDARRRRSVARHVSRTIGGRARRLPLARTHR